jgi:class 3 adenylate cyclase
MPRRRRRRDRLLATVLFTDIVNSSGLVTEVGDRRWRVLLARHHQVVRRELRRYGGRELDTAGDGFFASFDDPASAVRCACSIVGAVQALGLDIRAGLHFGEIEVMGGTLSGLAVHTGARVMSQAAAAEVLITAVLRDLLAGAGLTFEDRGTRELKGILGPRQLFAVTAVDGDALPGPLDEQAGSDRRAAIEVPPFLRRRSTELGVAVAVLAVASVVISLLIVGRHAAAPRSAAAPLDHVLLKVDPSSGRILDRIRLGLPTPQLLSVGPIPRTPRGLAVGEGSVWVTSRRLRRGDSRRSEWPGPRADPCLWCRWDLGGGRLGLGVRGRWGGGEVRPGGRRRP